MTTLQTGIRTQLVDKGNGVQEVRVLTKVEHQKVEHDNFVDNIPNLF